MSDRQRRRVLIHFYLLQWQLWPVWSASDPNKIYLGPIVITTWRS